MGELINTVSQEFKNALAKDTRFFDFKVFITRNNVGSIPIEISDRVQSYSVVYDYERRGSYISLEIDNYDFSYSPFNRDSTVNQVGGVYDPLLDSMHEILLYEGIMLEDGSYEYVIKFIGVLGDEIDADSYPGTVSVNARDKSKYLQDTYIYQSKTYKVTVVETVMQDMINQYVPHLNITVNVANPTEFMIGRPDSPYTAKDTNLWDALQTLADASSHILYFKEDGTLWLEKVRQYFDNAIPDMVLDDSSLIRDTISSSDSDVRNKIVLRIQGMDPIEKKNEDSIAKYGERYMEVHRGLSSVITTNEQAHLLAQMLLDDLEYPHPIDKVEIPYHPLIQVNDIVSINNGRIGTNEIYDIFSVTRVQNSYSSDKKRTSLYLKGFLTKNAINPIAPTPPTNLSFEIISRTIQNYPNSGWAGTSKTISFPLIKWSPPLLNINGDALDIEFGGYTIYRKRTTDTQWYPVGVVRSYIVSLGISVTYFYDYTVESGISYDYKIVAVTKLGGISADSSVLTVSIPAISYEP